jgi:hypothetical protein
MCVAWYVRYPQLLPPINRIGLLKADNHPKPNYLVFLYG